MCLTAFSTREKYYWFERKYLSAIQNRRRQLFCLHDNAFSQYAPAFASVIVACQLELERLYIYSIYIHISCKYSNGQILILSLKMHSLEISYLHQTRIEI